MPEVSVAERIKLNLEQFPCLKSKTEEEKVMSDLG